MNVDVLILGAGGHAWVVADIVLQMNNAGQSLRLLGFLDDDPNLIDADIFGFPVLGTISELASVPNCAVVIAIGDNRTRRCLFKRVHEQGRKLVSVCHPSAVIATDVTMGVGSVICAGVVVNPGSRIGANAILNTGCTVDHHNLIGDHVHIAPGVHLGGDVSIGEGALIGIGSTVMPQRSVGRWSVIGGGSLVAKDISDNVIAFGSPARVVQEPA